MRLTFGFSTSNSFLARCIRYFTKSEISHTYIRFYDPFLETEFVFHADFPFVLMEDWQLFKIHNKIIHEFEIDAPKVKSSIIQNLKMLRTKYHTWHLIYWAWVITFKRWIKKKIKNPLEDPKEIICVDFNLYITNRAELTSLPYDYYVPNTMFKWMEGNYEEDGWKWTIKDGNPNEV